MSDWGKRPTTTECPLCHEMRVVTRNTVNRIARGELSGRCLRCKSGLFTDRFWRRVDIGDPDDCWPWRGALTNGGYGRCWRDGHTVAATHVVLELDGRPLPDGLWALHSCDNRRCVNPRHLRHGTPLENQADMWERGRGNPPRGERQTSRTLSAADVREIRSLLSAGMKQIRVAGHFGVHPSTISFIATGRTWSSLS